MTVQRWTVRTMDKTDYELSCLSFSAPGQYIFQLRMLFRWCIWCFAVLATRFSFSAFENLRMFMKNKITQIIIMLPRKSLITVYLALYDRCFRRWYIFRVRNGFWLLTDLKIDFWSICHEAIYYIAGIDYPCITITLLFVCVHVLLNGLTYGHMACNLSRVGRMLFFL